MVPTHASPLTYVLFWGMGGGIPYVRNLFEVTAMCRLAGSPWQLDAITFSYPLPSFHLAGSLSTICWKPLHGGGAEAGYEPPQTKIKTTTLKKGDATILGTCLDPPSPFPSLCRLEQRMPSQTKKSNASFEPYANDAHHGDDAVGLV